MFERMKKMLFILPSLGGGGSERVVVNIIRYLDKTKYHITLALLINEGVYFDILPEYVRIIDLKSRKVRYSFLKILNVIRKEKPDILFSTFTEINIILCILKNIFKKIKLVIREGNIVSIHKNSKVKKAIYKNVISGADTIIVLGDDMKKDLVTNFCSRIDKIQKINNPVDFEYINKLVDEPLEFDAKPDKILLLAVGRLKYQKGFDLLLHSFSQLSNKDEYRLLILGSGILKEELIAQARREGIYHLVSFLDFENNPYKYMAKADYFISSSRYEGFPNAVLEALACGTPVIANNYPGGINEIINDTVGEIIDINDINALKNALSKKYDSDKIKMYCKNKYAIESIVKKYEEVFNCEGLAL